MMFYDLLVCLSCKSKISNTENFLECTLCGVKYPVIRNVARFVPADNYAQSFGLQWNRFEKTQLDSNLQTKRSEMRFLEETMWDSRKLKDKFVLDAGCGAGRFSEIALKHGANLVAVDFSAAVDAAQRNLASDSRLLIQADLAQLPIASNSLDYIYCIGVLQHTKNPELIIKELMRCLKPGGELSLTFYENSSWHVKFYSKYLIRPLTKRLDKKFLLLLLTNTSRFWFPLTSWLFKLPSPLPRVFRFMIPIANYVEYEYVCKEAAIDESILDTFDMLSPKYDRPIKKMTIISWLRNSGYEISELPHTPKFGNLRFTKI